MKLLNAIIPEIRSPNPRNPREIRTPKVKSGDDDDNSAALFQKRAKPISACGFRASACPPKPGRRWVGFRILNFGFRVVATASIMLGLGASAQSTALVSIQANQPGAVVSSNLFGIFFEEINFAGEGGL